MKLIDIPPKSDAEDVYWYHSMTFPDGEEVEGLWDLRSDFGAYTGHVHLKNKRVMDVGTASGFLAFEAEKAGAEVVSVDLPADGDWDVVPYATEELVDVESQLRERALQEATRYKRSNVTPLREGFFYAHHKNNSQVQLYESSVYEIDSSAGYFDVAIIGTILQHLRDPLQALHKIALVTKETIIVSDMMNPSLNKRAGKDSLMKFLPSEDMTITHAWWLFSDNALKAMLNVVGFEVSSVELNQFKRNGWDKHAQISTLVANRVKV